MAIQISTNQERLMPTHAHSVNIPTIMNKEHGAFSQSPLLDSVLKFRNASTGDPTLNPRYPEEMESAYQSNILIGSSTSRYPNRGMKRIRILRRTQPSQTRISTVDLYPRSGSSRDDQMKRPKL